MCASFTASSMKWKGQKMELLDLVNENGMPTGQVKERTLVHQDGDRHRTSHVWLVRCREGSWQVLLQKRSDSKDSHPGCNDISSAGHIPAGEDWLTSACRELLGLPVRPDALHEVGIRRFYWEGTFYGKPFRDRQVSKVYYLLWDGDPSALTLQKSEISQVRWMELSVCYRRIQDGTLPNCIFPGELELLADALGVVLSRETNAGD